MEVQIDMAKLRTIRIELPPELMENLDHIIADYDLNRIELVWLLIELAVEKLENKEWSLDEFLVGYFEEGEKPL